MFNLSIITINYNNKAGLKKTVDSVANQKFKDFEYIVIDGGSSDESINIIKENESSINYWVSEQDEGIYHAINKGINKSSGKYCMFLNSGDSLKDDNTLSLCMQNIINHSETDIFYGDIICENEDQTTWIRTHPQVLDLAFFQHNNLNHQASLIRSGLFSEFGNYPQKYKLASDHWLYIKCIIENKVFTYINAPLVFYDISGQSTKNRDIYDKEMEAIWEQNVPQYATTLSNLVNDFRLISGYKIVKAAININSKIQKIRKKVYDFRL